MINDKKILAIIPARGGSKRIPRKNVRIIGGKPLIAWTIEEAKQSKYIDDVVLSSDNDEIIEVAKQYGCNIPFKRPETLSCDHTPSIDVILHALNIMGNQYDYFILLQPTSPLREAKHIDESIDLCHACGAKTLVSVSSFSKGLSWIYEYSIPYIRPMGNLQSFDKIMNTKVILNGAIYFSDIPGFLDDARLIRQDTCGYLMDEYSSIDIDTPFDWEVAEYFLLKKQK